MVWVNCPRNVQDHNCPNEELGDWLDDALLGSIITPLSVDPLRSEFDQYCSGACEGEINVAYEEIEEQTCECVLTEREWTKVWERGDDAFIGQVEDYYESLARVAIDGNDY